MRYDELKDRVLKQAFPLGVPENLPELVDDYFRCALIEVQRWIDCYQVRHTNVYPACTTFVQCGATVLTKPQGSEVHRVYTVQRVLDSDVVRWCSAIPYNPVTLPEFRRWMAKVRSTYRYLATACEFRPDPEAVIIPCDQIPVGTRGVWCPPGSAGASESAFSEGFKPASEECDSPNGRALVGLYAIDVTANRIYVAPWVQWNEAVVVEWKGIKRDWADADLVPDSPDLVRLLRLWIQTEYARNFSCENLAIAKEGYDDALSDGMVTCQDEKRTHGDPRSPEEADLAWSQYLPTTPDGVPVPTPVTTSRIAFVGDFGQATPERQTVADQVHAADPALIVTLGDNRYDPLTVEQAFEPYAADVATEGKLVAAIGNHDLDDDDAAPLLAYVGNPGNERFYSVVRGPVEVFVFNSGINTAGEVKEMSGNYAGSQQWQMMVTAIARSCSPWKIAVIHHSPYTSAINYRPGITQFRWASDLLVHAVLAGHGHIYERGMFRNRLHIVAGTGGAPLTDIGTPVEGSEVQLKEFGFVLLEATPKTMTLKFVDQFGAVRDTVDVPGEILMAPIAVSPIPQMVLTP